MTAKKTSLTKNEILKAHPPKPKKKTASRPRVKKTKKVFVPDFDTPENQIMK